MSLLLNNKKEEKEEKKEKIDIICLKSKNLNIKNKILKYLNQLNKEKNESINIINKKKCIDKLNYFLIHNIYDSYDIYKTPFIILILNIYLENIIKNINYEII